MAKLLRDKTRVVRIQKTKFHPTIELHICDSSESIPQGMIIDVVLPKTGDVVDSFTVWYGDIVEGK